MALGCSSKTDKPPPAPAPAPVRAPDAAAPHAAPDAAAAPSSSAEDEAAKAAVRRMVDGLSKPVAPRALAGKILRGGVLVDVATLSPLVSVQTCTETKRWSKFIVRGNSDERLLELAIDDVGSGKRAKLVPADQRRGRAGAAVTVMTTDASGKTKDIDATGGSVVVHTAFEDIGSDVDVEFDVTFGSAGQVKGRFVVRPEPMANCVHTGSPAPDR